MGNLHCVGLISVAPLPLGPRSCRPPPGRRNARGRAPIELNGDDLRCDPLEVRKATLVTVLAGVGHGIWFNDHIEGDGQARVIAGSDFGVKSPVGMLSEWLYAEVVLAAGATAPLDPDQEERAI
jgi:hypothetical protein